MAEHSYIRQYFTDHAEAWIAGAYVDTNVAPKYPLGNERVALALRAVVERLGAPRGRLVDLGCGGGQLCFEAARLGMHATGVDLADGMVELCRCQTRELPAELQTRLDFHVGDVVDTGLPAGEFDAVAALGLIEYLPADEAFLSEAWRLLHPGGVLVLTCRNRLFNLFSQNHYTADEIDTGAAAALLHQVRSAAARDVTAQTFHSFFRSLKSALPQLEEALQRDLALAREPRGRRGEPFAQELRQHTPQEIFAAAERAGFTDARFVGVHPHPFPPGYERVAPHFFNTLARSLTVFAETPASLTWSSCFQVAFTKAL
jgi:SAM-dependent methyltransferase